MAKEVKKETIKPAIFTVRLSKKNSKAIMRYIKREMKGRDLNRNATIEAVLLAYFKNSEE